MLILIMLMGVLAGLLFKTPMVIACTAISVLAMTAAKLCEETAEDRKMTPMYFAAAIFFNALMWIFHHPGAEYAWLGNFFQHFL